MPKLPVLKAREVLKILKGLGFYEHHQVGSHIQLKHPDGRRTTVPNHPKKELKRKTISGIINDTGLTVEEFLKLSK